MPKRERRTRPPMPEGKDKSSRVCECGKRPSPSFLVDQVEPGIVIGLVCPEGRTCRLTEWTTYRWDL